MKKINWEAVFCLVLLIIFWCFALWVICKFIILKGKVNIYNNQEQFSKVIKSRKSFYIAATRKKEPEYRGDNMIPKQNTIRKMKKIIRKAAYKYNVNPAIMIKLAKNESGFNPNEIGDEDPRDRGLFQINRGFHPSVSDEEAFDPKFAAEWTAQKINQGKGYLWVAWDKTLRELNLK